MIQPLDSFEALEFLGKFVRYGLNTRRATSLPFNLHFVSSCFFSGRNPSSELPWAKAIKTRLDSFHDKQSRAKIDLRTISV